MPKVFKNGNSLVVSIPKSYAHQLSIRDGLKVQWKETEEGLVLMAERKMKKPTEIDPEVARLIKKISTKYAQVWQDLAKV